MPIGYDQDVAAWAAEQARLIREGRFDQLDIEHVADETEDVGKSGQRELASRIAVFLAHFLTWQVQPTLRGASRDRTIREQRKQALRKLKETPSLGPLLSDPEWSEGVWSDAVTLATSETGLDAFPEACPWKLPDVLEDGRLPS